MPLLDRITIVLDRPQDPVNIGAVVRAMRNMGAVDLRLVQPAPFERDELLRLAHRCEGLVDHIATFATLDAALADTHYVVGTAAIAHSGRPPVTDIRGLAADLVPRAAGERVALLFGTEADGLDRAALDRCHLIATLPTDPDYPALNLAQSALLFLYELRMAALAGVSATGAVEQSPGTSQADLERLFDLSEAALAGIGFFRYNPAPVMRTLRQIVYRASLSPEETALLMAIARRIQQMSGRS
jgi:TrmH family RNA methyltransferase